MTPTATKRAPATGPARLEATLADDARRLGFAAFGITRPAAIGEAGARLAEFLALGHHGDMEWMAATADRRRDPRVLWPEARSVIMLGVSYTPETDPMAALEARSNGVISVYAQTRDYHDVLKSKLKLLAHRVQSLAGGDVKVFVDTAPLMEKPLAAAAGLGWQGKHTNLVSRDLGSWFFLGAILTTADLSPDPPETDHCGTCSRCLDICPTRAFPAPYRLDARRCISYLTIEHKGHIAPEFRRAIGNRIYGCDDCLAVCPWNKFAATAREAGLVARAAAANPPLVELLGLDDAAFRVRFSGSPIKRTGRDRFVRNVLIAAGNSDDPTLIQPVESLLSDASPLVRAMAVWALRRLADPQRVARARDAHLAVETDADVRREWLAEDGA